MICWLVRNFGYLTVVVTLLIHVPVSWVSVEFVEFVESVEFVEFVSGVALQTIFRGLTEEHP
jgi:hypothetical protein